VRASPLYVAPRRGSARLGICFAVAAQRSRRPRELPRGLCDRMQPKYANIRWLQSHASRVRGENTDAAVTIVRPPKTTSRPLVICARPSCPVGKGDNSAKERKLLARFAGIRPTGGWANRLRGLIRLPRRYGWSGRRSFHPRPAPPSYGYVAIAGFELAACAGGQALRNLLPFQASQYLLGRRPANDGLEHLSRRLPAVQVNQRLSGRRLREYSQGGLAVGIPCVEQDKTLAAERGMGPAIWTAAYAIAHRLQLCLLAGSHIDLIAVNGWNR
jgi:hypothetical protein